MHHIFKKRPVTTGRRIIKGGLGLLTALAMVFSGLSAAPAEVRAAELTGKTSMEITADMGLGWNLGNTFDSTGGNLTNLSSLETSWGNPKVNEALISGIADAGFKTIRIPVTWYRAFTDKNHTISEKYLERVREVVDLCYKYDLYIILNIHHENWLNVATLSANYLKIGEELADVWSQIAVYFGDYDQHLIFEGMNEPRLAGTAQEWTGNDACYKAVNYLSQVFVSTVRSTAGSFPNNAERCLAIPGYAASSSAAILSAISLPTWDGELCKNLIVEVHCYSPYEFCLSNRNTFDPDDSSDTGGIDSAFNAIDELFLSNGVPAIIDEASATNNGDNTEARCKWLEYIAKRSSGYSVPVVLWDNGSDGKSGGECHSYLDRRTGKPTEQKLIDAFIGGAASVTAGSMRKGPSSEGELKGLVIDGTVIWQNSSGLKNTQQWEYNYIKTPSKPSFYGEGGEIGIVYKPEGSGEPKIILDSSANSAWWIPIDMTRKETKDVYTIAWFTYADIVKACKANKVNDLKQLSDFSVVAANGDITTYEIVAVGGSSDSVSCYANGVLISSGNKLPADPVFKGLKFLGWYTTRTYAPGTEYVPGSGNADTIFAKFGLEEKEPAEVPTAAVTTSAPSPTQAGNAGGVTPTTTPTPSGSSVPVIPIAAGAVLVVAAAAFIVIRATRKK